METNPCATCGQRRRRDGGCRVGHKAPIPTATKPCREYFKDRRPKTHTELQAAVAMLKESELVNQFRDWTGPEIVALVQALDTVLAAAKEVPTLEAEVTRLNGLVTTEHQAYLRADERATESEENAERYAVLKGRHFENLPGDSATLYSGSCVEASAPDLDALADRLRGEKPEVQLG